jgi:hypothetical protein
LGEAQVLEELPESVRQARDPAAAGLRRTTLERLQDFRMRGCAAKGAEELITDFLWSAHAGDGSSARDGMVL